MQKTQLHKQKGFSLVEMMIALAIMLIVAASLVPLMVFVNQSAHSNQDRMTASNLAASIMEEIRALDYEQIGSIGGNPVGPIPQMETHTVNGRTFVVETLVSWGSVIGKDNTTNPVAQKNVRVIVKGKGIFSGSEEKLAELHTIFTRDGEEPLIENGHIRVGIRDTSNAPVVTPVKVEISGPETASIFTDYSGFALFGILDQGIYQVKAYIPKGMIAIGGDSIDMVSRTIQQNNVEVKDKSTTDVTFFMDNDDKAAHLSVQLTEEDDGDTIARNGTVIIGLEFGGETYSIEYPFTIDDFTDGILPSDFFGFLPSGALCSIKVKGVVGYSAYDMESDPKPILDDGTAWDGILPEPGLTVHVRIPMRNGYIYEEISKNDFENYQSMSLLSTSDKGTVQVDDDTLTLEQQNSVIISTGKLYEASSADRPSANAFDDNTNTQWVAAKTDTKPWLQVDFRGYIVVNKFDIVLKNKKRPKGFKIWVSNDKSNWTQMSTSISSFSDVNTLQTVTFSPVSCRYFKIEIIDGYNGGNSICITEMRVYSADGYPPNGYRIIKPIILDGLNPAPGLKIDWNADTPTGTDVEIYALILDSGVTPSAADFTAGTLVGKNERIPGSCGTNLNGKQLWIMEKLTSTDASRTPTLYWLRVEEE